MLEIPTYAPQQSNANIRHLRGAMYMGGYAVECLLKAYLISFHECRSLTQAVEKIDRLRISQGKEPVEKITSSAAGHDLFYLVGLTDLGIRPGYSPKLWGRLSQWKSTWRYDPKSATREEAERFINDVTVATNWLKPSVIS